MSSTLFIHGFCSEVCIPSLGIRTCAGSEFDVFRKDRSNTHVFTWALSTNLSFWEAVNPVSYLELYKNELFLSTSPTVLQGLHLKIQEVQPSVMFAHSMGCLLLLFYIEQYSIPTSVKRIIFVQADIPEILSKKVEAKLSNRNIKIENFYCPWDQALLASTLYHFQKRAGVSGVRSKQVINNFYPLIKLWNLHTAGLRSITFYTKCCKLT